MVPVSLFKLKAVFNNMVGRVSYALGDKAQDLSEDSHEIDAIDCSGFVRYALYRATDGKLVIPDGSFIEHEWFQSHGYKKLAHYSDVQYAAQDPSRLFVAFLPPEPVGHVWLVRAGMTLESHGHKGVDSRWWDTHVLLGACACYEIPTVA